MPAHYDYLTFNLVRGRQAWADFAAHMRAVTPKIAEAGGTVLGLFQPQLGFGSNEAVVLLRWPEGGREHLCELDQAPGVNTMHPERLTPTVRPGDSDALKRGGIYVHRWFTVDADSVADFIALSNQAWTGFEGSYNTQIFGLFTAERTPADLREGAGRLLLLTWYASHGVWEESREPARDPNSLFAKRHALTRTTVGRSSLLV